ncbi:MAG: GTPase [Planctomycetota bacterium]
MRGAAPAPGDRGPAGPPNAGKSSLFNALLTRERALVSAEAGTTRDGVGALTLAAGVPVRLVDTAGDREATDALERAGIARARALGAEADLRLLLLDPEDPGLPAWASAEPEPRLVLWGKADRVDLGRRSPGLWVSAATGEGLDALRAALAEALVPAAVWSGPCAFTARQLGWVDAARAALAQDGLERAWDLLARAWAEAPPPVTRRSSPRRFPGRASAQGYNRASRPSDPPTEAS